MSARVRRQLVDICRHLYDRFYLVATDGNVSVRLDENRLLTTPSGANKGFLAPEDLVLTDMDGQAVGGGKPSSELAMHLMVYRLRPDVGSVVHAHPRAATAFASAGVPLDSCLMTESICGLGQVPLAPLGMPSTPELAESIRDLVPRTQTILLRSHGVIAYGADLMAAYNAMEGVEQFAQVQLRVLALGGGSVEARKSEQLLALRAGYGWTAPVIPCDPESPLARARPGGAGSDPVARALTRLRTESSD